MAAVDVGELAFAPGLEASGSVAAVGEGVTRVKPGDRVLAFARHGGGNHASRMLRHGRHSAATLAGGMAALAASPVRSRSR